MEMSISYFKDVCQAFEMKGCRHEIITHLIVNTRGLTDSLKNML
jgi:hypothetical protein